MFFINKVSPKIPEVSQLRPISIQSPIIKFLEYSIKSPLESIIRQCLSKTQTGFEPTIGTAYNLRKMARH